MIKYVRIIDKFPQTPLNKISIVQVYVFNKLQWRLAIYDLTETWVDKNIDKIILKFLRKWCQLPVCANVEHLSFPLLKLGVNFKSAKMLYNPCKLSTRRILRLSKNPEIQNLYTFTSSKHINHVCLIITLEITLRHGCYPVSLLHIFRTPFYKNTSGWLLLFYLISTLILESTVNITKVYLIISGTDL